MEYNKRVSHLSWCKVGVDNAGVAPTPTLMVGLEHNRTEVAMKHGMTVEEKAAKKIAAIVNDLTIDLDMVGEYLAKDRNVTYNRIVAVVEAAEYTKEKMDYGYNNYTLC